jgi:Uma2 family endonuclease
VPAAVRTVTADPDWLDHYVVLHDVSWDTYVRLERNRGDSAVPRMTYLEGTLELMSPGRAHELGKKALGRLLEAWADEAGTVLEGVGSWTVKRRRARRGAEPDECYVVGRPASAVLRPDIAIEVVSSRGAIDKLEVWRKLAVSEVWIWEKGRLAFHLLRGERYARALRSKLLPKLDPALVEECMRAPTQTEAVRRLRRRLRAGK